MITRVFTDTLILFAQHLWRVSASSSVLTQCGAIGFTPESLSLLAAFGEIMAW